MKIIKNVKKRRIGIDTKIKKTTLKIWKLKHNFLCVKQDKISDEY